MSKKDTTTQSMGVPRDVTNNTKSLTKNEEPPRARSGFTRQVLLVTVLFFVKIHRFRLPLAMAVQIRNHYKRNFSANFLK